MKWFNEFSIKKYIECIDKDSKVSEVDKERIKFAITTLSNEIKKYLIIIVIFLVMDKIVPLVISFLTLISIRLELGGVHCKKNWQCIIVTFTYFFLTITFAENVRLLSFEIILVEGLSIITIVYFTPINSMLRNVNDKKTVMKLKWKVLIVLVVIFIIMNTIVIEYRNYVVWSLVFILIEILIYLLCELRRRRKSYE